MKRLSAMMIATAIGLYSLATHAGPPPGVKLENLMNSDMTGVDQREMIISRVSIPPHTRLPVHWHPGEEFAYIIEGSVTLWQKDKANIVGRQGDIMKVPFKQVHTAETGDEAAVILVVRIHERGEPERVMVEQTGS